MLGMIVCRCDALACIIHEVLFSDDFFERETKRHYWRKELELKG
jgi:hypothetical protein